MNAMYHVEYQIIVKRYSVTSPHHILFNLPIRPLLKDKEMLTEDRGLPKHNEVIVPKDGMISLLEKIELGLEIGI